MQLCVSQYIYKCITCFLWVSLEVFWKISIKFLSFVHACTLDKCYSNVLKLQCRQISKINEVELGNVTNWIWMIDDEKEEMHPNANARACTVNNHPSDVMPISNPLFKDQSPWTCTVNNHQWVVRPISIPLFKDQSPWSCTVNNHQSYISSPNPLFEDQNTWSCVVNNNHSNVRLWQGCLIMEKLIITIYFVHIEITIIQAILLEFKTWCIYSAFLSKKTLCNWELRNFTLKKRHKMSNRKCSFRK